LKEDVTDGMLTNNGDDAVGSGIWNHG
jgi:hypothetical protein